LLSKQAGNPISLRRLARCAQLKAIRVRNMGRDSSRSGARMCASRAAVASKLAAGWAA